MTRGRPVLVGEAPCRRGGPPFGPDTPSGRRLAALMGVRPDELARHLDALNLLPEWPGSSGKGSRFPVDEARRAAFGAIAFASRRRRAKMVLVGRRVARAFGVRWRPLVWTVEFDAIVPGGVAVAMIPHPSGVDRHWNDPANREAARTFLRSAVGLG